MFHKILIANRGEIAVRIMRTCQVMGIHTAAVYSDADADALHVRLADEAVHIGAAPSTESYLREDKIIQAALQTNSDAIHPGYGFLAENADFAEAVRDAGLVLIAPPAEAIRSMGSKTEARRLMQSAGIPVVPGYQGNDLIAEAKKIGYPLMIKAAAGGGGKGMRVVHHPDELPEALASAQREAASAFGDDTLFLEKYLPVSHHIEFQILADSHGNTVHLFERECSIQRRHQKIIEETPSPLLNDDLRADMGQAAVAAALAVGYINAGTIEFIVDEDRNFYFLEMNTRLQVEHPVTEWVTGVDLVRLQIEIAAGHPLPFTQQAITQRGHAIECRIYAEDPANDFLPDVGKLLLVKTPDMPNVRVDTGFESGDTVTPFYDPMIAKLITYGRTRDDAIQHMQTALRECVILGVATNIPFLQNVIQSDAFRAGDTTTAFIPQHFPDWQPAAWDEGQTDIALITAALAEMNAAQAVRNAADSTHLADAYNPWAKNDGFRLGAGS